MIIILNCSYVGTHNTAIMKKRDNIHFCVGENFVTTAVSDDGGPRLITAFVAVRCARGGRLG